MGIVKGLMWGQQAGGKADWIVGVRHSGQTCPLAAFEEGALTTLGGAHDPVAVLDLVAADVLVPVLPRRLLQCLDRRAARRSVGHGSFDVAVVVLFHRALYFIGSRTCACAAVDVPFHRHGGIGVPTAWAAAKVEMANG